MNAWTVIFAAGLGSYLLRLSMVTIADRVRMPRRLDEASGLIAPAAFAALAATSVTEAALGDASAAAAPLAAVAVAVLAVARTGKPYAAMLAGMPTLWLATAVLPV